MQDMNAANTGPRSGEMGVWNDASASNTRVLAHSEPDQQAVPIPRQCILVVEDDTPLAQLVAEVLSTHGYVVSIAESGEQAIKALSVSIPDLVVLDLELPDQLNGWDVFQVLRRHAQVPVLITTSLETNMRRNVRDLKETRLTLDYLAKPYPMQTFLKRVKHMLQRAPQ